MASFHNPKSLVFIFIQCMFRRTFGFISVLGQDNSVFYNTELQKRKIPLYKITDLINLLTLRD